MTSIMTYLKKYNLSEIVLANAGDQTYGLMQYTLVLNTRATSRYGCVKYRSKTVEISAHYYNQNGTVKDGELDDHNNTLLHEVAHVIARLRHGKCVGHNYQWKAIMRSLGADPSRTGSSKILDNLGDDSHKHEYACACGHVFKTKRTLKRAGNRFHGACKRTEHGGRLTHTQVR